MAKYQSGMVKFKDVPLTTADTKTTDVTKTGVTTPSPYSASKQPDTSAPAESSDLGRVEFTPKNHRQFVSDHGLSTYWEQAFLCPCRDPMTKAPNPLCLICHGTGIGYLPAKALKIAIQGQAKGVTYRDIGLTDSGSALGTVQLGYNVSFRDRITVPDVPIVQSYLFNVTQTRLESGQRIPYDVLSIDYIRTLERNLEPDKDYTFDADTDYLKILNKDLLGQNITMNISVTLRYIVTDLLKESRYQYVTQFVDEGKEQFNQLARLVLLKREDAWINNAPLIMPNSTDDEAKAKAMNDPKRNMSTDNGGFAL